MEKKVTIGGQIHSSINFAMQQNYVPMIRSLVITNQSEEKLGDLHLRITFEPAFAKEFTCDVEAIEAGESVEISPVRISLSTEFLFSLTEKLVGTMEITLTEGQEAVGSCEKTVELLAYDQWSGLSVMPEMIAAFVTPNHPRIAQVLTQASGYLNQWTKKPAFTGYQTRNPNNVKLQMAAIYAALQSAGIVYGAPPASYEALGQRVRLPHAVLEKQQGTCLDLAVLYAACLEAVGLFGLLVFEKGHAYAGCWLEEQTFADCAVDDVSALEKRIVEGSEELLLVECTDFTAGKNVNFEKALKHGRDHLLDISRFMAVIDVQRTRGSGIRPMAVQLEQARLLENGSDQELAFEEERKQAPKQLQLLEMEDLSQTQEVLTKQKVWERKLLDFSLRNALLNFRANKNSLQLMTADLGELEDKLSDGSDFRVLEVPAEWTVSLRDARIYEIENEKDLIQSIAAEEFKSGRIRTFLPEEQLTAYLKNLYRQAKVSMEENGTNTLFLALGFLRWFESDVSEKARYAPIVLVPVDIVKSTRNKGYVIRSRQEEAQVNITLLEYLRQIFGLKITGLDPLPADEHGVNLPLVFHTIRQAIMGKARWNIENLAFIGLFSFGQFVMWNDIRNRSADLEANKVVSSLIEGRLNWTPKEQTVTLENLDTVVHPSRMAIPMSADSSQMVAIAAAADGQSFVLHGPPGTGKSQTITNMIANALYQGKTVLFVAEKMAALNVVQNRLAGIGLDPFCLELHSNKTNKSAVLSQLNQALEVGQIRKPQEYEATAERIYQLRKELNAVIDALHGRRDYGCSLYEAIERFEAVKEEKGNITFAAGQLEGLTEERIEQWRQALRAYSVATEETGPYSDSPLREYEGSDYSMELREKLAQDLNILLADSDSVTGHVQELKQWVQAGSDESRRDVLELCRLAELAQNPASTLDRLILSQDYDSLYGQLCRLVSDGMEYAARYRELSGLFEPQVFSYDAGAAFLRWKQVQNSWFLPQLTGKNKLVKELKLYARNPSAVTKDTIVSYYEKLMTVAELKAKLNQAPAQLTWFAGSLYQGVDSDWTVLSAALGKADEIHQLTAAAGTKKQECYVQALLNPADRGQLAEHQKAVREYVGEIDRVTETCQIRLPASVSGGSWLKESAAVFKRLADHLPQLRSWTTMRRKAQQLRNCGLADAERAWQTGRVTPDRMNAAFDANLYYGLVLKTVREDERLKDFRGKQYEDMIRRYDELIEKFRVLTIQELAARLSAQVPASGTAGAASSELGILKRAIKSNGRMLSIRRLFDQIPTLLRKLCPCMLMSPISVAQYIDPAFPKFDLVIFDEASQLPTSEAVGTIARGENVVVVGDPKQLPPTSFFSSNRVDEDNMDKEDLESLLDDCLSISMPQMHLKWHYRSRHESLIAYSNMKYYDNQLYTFPSPNDLVSEVRLVHVDGCYDKGKTKQNKEEAKAVVDEIIRRMRDEKLKNDSIGVVTFSSVQQNLIDDMLAEEFARHPELEEQDRAAREPVFIKNLENVQGDERDVILFSVGYGPDKDGRVSMNFGPLNRDGGWRRLNVAVSRARKHMIVYSTLRPEQIDLSRTRAEGVAGLRGFLEFAERGKNVLASRAGTSAKREDTLIEELAGAVRAMGYEVKCNIGCSRYKMDLGVVHPRKPDTYVLGILLDGENCREAATSKDRFILQPGVLQGLGWHILRVWTLEWLDNPEQVLKLIRRQIGEVLEAEESETVEVISNQKEEIIFERLEPSEAASVKSAAQPYEVQEVGLMGTPESFYEPRVRTVITRTIRKILTKEAPISRKALMRRVLAAWSISRAGSRVEIVFDEALSTVAKQETKDGRNLFYWRPDQDPEVYNGYRVEDPQGNKRSMDDISSYEILNAVVEVLTEQVGLSREDLIRETAKKFGFSRMGNVIETAISGAIDRGEALGRLEIKEGDKVVLS